MVKISKKFKTFLKKIESGKELTPKQRVYFRKRYSAYFAQRRKK